MIKITYQSNGDGITPIAPWWYFNLSWILSSLMANDPIVTSECPCMYFVIEYTTMSAPKSSGRWKYEDKVVLSTTIRTFGTLWRIKFDTFAMSMTFSLWLVGVSIQTSLRFSFIEFFSAIESLKSTKVTGMSMLTARFLNKIAHE